MKETRKKEQLLTVEVGSASSPKNAPAASILLRSRGLKPTSVMMRDIFDDDFDVADPVAKKTRIAKGASAQSCPEKTDVVASGRSKLALLSSLFSAIFVTNVNRFSAL